MAIGRTHSAESASILSTLPSQLSAELLIAELPAELPIQLPIRGVELIKQFSDCRLQSYRQCSQTRPFNQHTHHKPLKPEILPENHNLDNPEAENTSYRAGWGSMHHKNGTPFVAGEQLTYSQAHELLCRDLREKLLPKLVALSGWRSLNENQQGALLSFAHSFGDDLFALSPQLSLARALRDRRWYLIPDILEHYYGPNPSVNIAQRRQAEAQLFLTEIRQDSYTTINQSRQLSLTSPALQGQDVQALQIALSQQGYEIVLDGSFGPMTQWAVEKFQLAAGLPMNGIADVKTQRILHARPLYLNDPYLIGSDVREVQSQLARVGYDVNIDGIFGLKTWQAVIRFQQYYELPDNGVVKGKTLTQLLYLPELTQSA